MSLIAPSAAVPGLYPVRAELALTGSHVTMPPAWRQVVEDVCVVTVGTPAEDSLLRLVTEPEPVDVNAGETARLAVTVGTDAHMDLAVEAHLISPWGTWEWLGPAAVGAELPARGKVELGFDVAPPPWVEAGEWWALVRVGCAGRLVYSLRGEGDGAMSVAASGRERAGARRRGRCPRRPVAWLTTCVVAATPRHQRRQGAAATLADAAAGDERVVAAEAATRGRQPTVRRAGRAAAGHDDPTGDRQYRRVGAGSPIPLARALFASVTAAVDVTDAEVRDYLDRKPRRFGSTAEIADHLRGAARRRAFRLWLDKRCAELVELAPGYEHPGDPRQPDNTHRH